MFARAIVLKPYTEFYYNKKKIRSDDFFCIQIKGIRNIEFKETIGNFINDLMETSNPKTWGKQLQGCVNAVRCMDPVLSEFRKTQYGYGIEIEIQLGKIGELRQWGAVDESKEIKLSFKRLKSDNPTLHTFIHELIHIVQFSNGYDMTNPDIEDELNMLEVAETYLPETPIPKLFASLIDRSIKN